MNKHYTPRSDTITKTCLYNFDPLKPHFYIVKLGFTGVNIIFLNSAHNIDCGYSLEPPRRGGSNEYPQSMFWAEIWKISDFFIWKFSFFGGKIFSIYSNRHVFVMPHTALSHQNCLPLTQQFFSYTRRLRKWRPIFRTRMERSYMYRGRIQSFLCSAMVRRRHKIISSYWCKIHHICDIYINQEVCRLKEFYLPRDRIYTFCAHISWTVSKLPNSTNVFFFLQSMLFVLVSQAI